MPIRLLSGVLLIATLAAVSVWLLTVVTFVPGAWVDNRPVCSGAVTMPARPGEPARTFPPTCRQGPPPADALGPSPTPAVATFLAVGTVGLFAAEALSRRANSKGRRS